MREIRLKVSELFEVDVRSGEDIKDLVAITAYVLKHYAFLPKPIIVTLEGEEVLISFPEESDAKKEEAARLADRAVKRASEGNYEKAIGIYKRVLELQPSFHSARRDLAMAYASDGKDLAELLVSKGLARIYGTRTPLPDGRDSRTYLARLRELEAEAKAARRGGWAKERGE